MNKKSIYFKITLVGIVLITYIFLLMNLNIVNNFVNNGIALLEPFILGFIIAYLINPMMKKIESIKQLKQMKKKRIVSISISYIVVITLISLLLFFVIPSIWLSINDLIKDIPLIGNKIIKWVNEIEDIKFINENIKIKEILTNSLSGLINELTKNGTDYAKTILNYTASISKTLLNIILGIIISIYMLSQKEGFIAQSKKTLYAYLPEEKVKTIINTAKTINNKFSNFIISKIIDSTIIGILCFIGVCFIGNDNKLLIATIVGVTNIIPYFGPFIGGIPCAIIAIADNTTRGIIFGIFIIALQQFDGNILGPKIMGDKLNLNAFWIIFAVLIMTGILGLTGMLIGVPLFAVIYMFINNDIHKRLKEKGKSENTEDYI